MEIMTFSAIPPNSFYVGFVLTLLSKPTILTQNPHHSPLEGWLTEGETGWKRTLFKSLPRKIFSLRLFI